MAGTLINPQALIFFLIPLFQNLGQKVVSQQKWGGGGGGDAVYISYFSLFDYTARYLCVKRSKKGTKLCNYIRFLKNYIYIYNLLKIFLYILLKINRMLGPQIFVPHLLHMCGISCQTCPLCNPFSKIHEWCKVSLQQNLICVYICP